MYAINQNETGKDVRFEGNALRQRIHAQHVPDCRFSSTPVDGASRISPSCSGAPVELGMDEDLLTR
jgi:hypothetical protein